jgi:hypothetical protein
LRINAVQRTPIRKAGILAHNCDPEKTFRPLCKTLKLGEVRRRQLLSAAVSTRPDKTNDLDAAIK